MGAPSSEQEARATAAEIDRRPRLREVTERMLALIEDPTTSPRRKASLESLVGCLDTGLVGDISEAEHADWMRVLTAAADPLARHA